jgi:hypothetical protein
VKAGNRTLTIGVRVTPAPNTFRQHIPGFVGDPDDSPKEYTFETTEELLALEVVQRYGKGPDFSHFALFGDLLMEISDGGRHWWVVGYLGDPTSVDLPQWVPPSGGSPSPTG